MYSRARLCKQSRVRALLNFIEAIPYNEGEDGTITALHNGSI